MRKILFLLTLLLSVCSGTWAQMYYYGAMTLSDGSLKNGVTHSTIQFVKDGITLEASTDLMMDSNPTTGSYYYLSNSLNASDLANSNNWTTSDSDKTSYIRGLKFAKSNSYTLKLGDKAASSITFYGKCGNSNATLTIDGVDFNTTTKDAFLYNTFTKNDSFTGDVTITQTGDYYGILVIEVPAGPNIFAFDTSITASERSKEVTQEIIVTGNNLTGTTLTATLSPAVDGLTVTLAEDKIANGEISTTATLHYTATENASGTTTLILSDGETTKAVTVTYRASVEEWTLQDVTDNITWNFIDLANSVPADVMGIGSECVMENLDGVTSIPTFDATKICANGSTNKNIIRKKELCAQGATLRFHTIVAGEVTVKFSNTGGNDIRYVVVNGEKSKEGSTDGGSSGSKAISATFSVEAGDVKIEGTDDAGSSQDIRIYEISFTPSAAYLPKTTIVSTTGYASFSSNVALDFTDAEVAAYVISELSETSATLEQVYKVPAETGLILIGEANKDYTVNVLATDESDVKTNKLTGAPNGTTVEANSVYVVNEGKLSLFTGTVIPAGKAYLLATEVPATASALGFNFGETTGISTTLTNNEAKNNVFYNLAGQRVAQPTKGLYIVNGKKVIIK